MHDKSHNKSNQVSAALVLSIAQRRGLFVYCVCVLATTTSSLCKNSRTTQYGWFGESRHAGPSIQALDGNP